VEPLSAGFGGSAQQYPFLVELQSPGVEEVVIGTLLTNTQEPYVKALIGTVRVSLVEV